MAGQYPMLAVAMLMLPLLAALVVQSPDASAATSDDIFVITSQTAALFVAHDGSADIRYDIAISVRPQSGVVETLTIHLPNWRFETSTMTVLVDGVPHRELKKTGSAENDLRIYFNRGEGLQPGNSYVISVLVNVGAMAQKSPRGANLARVAFVPTWWNADIVQDIQSMKVSINLPEGFLDQSKVQYTDGATIIEYGNRIVLTWTFSSVAPDQKNTFYADFPASAVTKVYDPFWDIQFHFYQNYLLIFVVIIPVAIAAVIIKRAMRKPYVKPYLNIEGWGPRTGFGPMEAAILLELPMERVATMYLLDLVMVDAIEIKDPQSMAIEIKNPDHEGRSAQLLGCIRAGRLDPIPTTNFLGSVKDEVASKLEGYDITETKDSYRSEGPRRWGDLGRADTPTIDDVLWMMTDPKAKKRFKESRFATIPDWTDWKVTL